LARGKTQVRLGRRRTGEVRKLVVLALQVPAELSSDQA
jgi:hypothetical protein